jgi:phage terminase small subunit
VFTRQEKTAWWSDSREGQAMNHRQQLFVGYYTGDCQGNATAAARKAGYSDPENAASRLMRTVEIAEAIQARAEAVTLTQDEVLAHIGAVAEADLGDFLAVGADGLLDLDEQGRPRIDLKRAAAAGKLGLVKRVSANKHGVVVELHDRMKALELLGRFHGLWQDRTGLDLAPEVDLAKLSDQELADLRDRLQTRRGQRGGRRASTSHQPAFAPSGWGHDARMETNGYGDSEGYDDGGDDDSL